MSLKKFLLLLCIVTALSVIGVGAVVYKNLSDNSVKSFDIDMALSTTGKTVAESTVPLTDDDVSPSASSTTETESMPTDNAVGVSPSVRPHNQATSAQMPENQAGQGQSADKKVIVIDAGHQSRGDSNLEAVGPGSSEMKAKVSSGTQGKYTGLPEYKLNLKVALELQIMLESKGYSVVMVRTTNDVDISNVARAEIANEAGADAFIRIHANGSDDPKENGVMTICQTKKNPYNGGIYQQCLTLSEALLDSIVDVTGADNCGVWQTDTMSGINWSKVPVTIVEMGFMTNEKEDKLMATDNYQKLIAQGIADGLDQYFKESQ